MTVGPGRFDEVRRPPPSIPPRRVHLVATQVADSARWMRTDAVVRLLPFSLTLLSVELIWRPRWLGISTGRTAEQLVAGLAAALVLFALAVGLRVLIARRLGRALVPADGSDLGLQIGYYALNAPLEEGIFRGLLQGGMVAWIGPLPGIVIATAAYSLYHRFGGWHWPEVGATALAGLGLALIYQLLPGPPSLLAVSIAHLGATNGFLGLGPALLRRMDRL